MDKCPDIGDHGLIGDLQTAALVTTDGVLDWFCCPRFDSPSVLGRRLEEARLVFEKMFSYANHLGLFSEEIDAPGGQLGNFPQAFSHLSLISAAINLNHQLDHGPGTV
jgi:GH15 family glucan-1,4-alpha-glucosidase